MFRRQIEGPNVCRVRLGGPAPRQQIDPGTSLLPLTKTNGQTSNCSIAGQAHASLP